MNGLGAFNWGNLLGSVVGNIIGQTSAPPVKPPAAAPVATPAVVAKAAVQQAEKESAMAKYWPIMAAAGVGILGVGAVVLLKKRA